MTASKVTRKSAKLNHARKPAKSAGIAASSLLLSGLLMAYGAGVAGAAPLTISYQDDWFKAPAGSDVAFQAADNAIFTTGGAGLFFSHSLGQTGTLTLGDVSFLGTKTDFMKTSELNINGVLNTGNVTVDNGGTINVLAGAALSTDEAAPVVGAGTLNIGKNLVLGGASAGTLNSAGVLNVTGTTTLNGTTTTTNPGILNITAGTATFTGATNLGTGADADGNNAINISGGEAIFTGALNIGNNSNTNKGKGTFTMSGGTASANAITLDGANGSLLVGNTANTAPISMTVNGLLKTTNDGTIVVDGNSAINTATLIFGETAKLNLDAATAITVNADGVLDLGSRNVTTALATDNIILGSEIGTGNTGAGGITFAGGTIKTTGSFVSTNAGDITFTNTNTGNDLHANIEAAAMSINNGSNKLIIDKGMSVNLSNATAYLNAASVELTQGTLIVTGDLSLNNGAANKFDLINAKTSTANTTVESQAGNASHVITTGNAYAGGAVIIGNGGIGDTGGSLTVATLDTTYNKLGGTNAAAGQNVTVTGANSTLKLTKDTGIVLNLGNTTNKLSVAAGGILEVAGDMTISDLAKDSGNTAANFKSNRFAQNDSAANVLFSDTNSTLAVTGTLTVDGTELKLGTADTDTFGGNLTAGALKVGTAGDKGLSFIAGAGTLTLTGLAIPEEGIAPKFLEATGPVAVANGTLVLGKNGQDTTIGGTYANKITVANPGALTLLGGKFDILGDPAKKDGITTSGSAAVKIGDGTVAMAGHGQLTGGLTHSSTGNITVDLKDNTSSYTIDNLTMSGVGGDLVMTSGTLNVTDMVLSNTGKIAMTNGTLNVGTLDSTNAAVSASTVAAGTLNVDSLNIGAADTFTLSGTGTMKIGSFAGAGSPASHIDVGAAGTTLDLSNMNITDFSAMSSGAVKSVAGFDGKITVVAGTVKTTGTASYKGAALTLDTTGTASAALFKGDLIAGVLDVKNAAGTAAEAVTVATGTELGLYGNETEFLNASKATVTGDLVLGFHLDEATEKYDPATGLFGTLTLAEVRAERAKTLGGTSSANVVLNGGNLDVSTTLFKFHNATNDATISTDTTGSAINVTQGGKLAADKIDFGTTANTQNLSIQIGSSLASDAYYSTSGSLAVTSMTNFNAGDVLNVNRGIFNYGSLDTAWMDNAITREHLNNGFATLGVTGSGLNLTGGQWSIGSDKANTFGATSLTVVSAKDYNTTDKVAITVDSANIEAGAGLLIDTKGITDTHTLTVLKSDAAVTGEWTNVNSASRLFEVTLSQSTDKKLYNATVGFADLNKTLPGISGNMASFIRALPLDQLDVNSPNYGLRFMARALDRSEYLPGVGNDRSAAITMEGAAQMAVIGAVPSSTMNAVTAINGGMSARTSIMSPLADITAVAMTDDGLNLDAAGMNAGSSTPGFGLWAMPLYQNTKAKGLKAGNFETGFDSQLYGMAIGADYTLPNNIRLGATFNVGAGDADSTGNFNKTENDFDFVGIGLYAGWAMNNFGLSADLGYTWSNNDVTQNLPSTMRMAQLKSDVDSSALTLGLRGEYKYNVGNNFNIMPHLGLRYTHLSTDSYNVKSAGNTVFHAGSENMDVFSIPVGVAFSKDFNTSNGWLVKPQIDLGATFNVGDVDAMSHVSIPGVNASADLKSRVMDRTTFDASLGLSTEKGSVSFGLAYDFRVGSDTTSHGVNAMLRYKF